MMQRNLDRRVETSFPIESPKLRNEIQKTILRFCLKDNVKARELHSDMSYTFCECTDKSKQVDSQEWLMNHAIKSNGKFVKPKVG
jgi:polyphosphate kinase